MTYYERLDIPQGTDPAQLKAAYFAALRKYPPERYPQEFKEVRHAYEVLCNPEERAHYDATLGMSEREREIFEAAEDAFSHRQFLKAIKLLEGAAKETKASSRLLLFLGNCYMENENSMKAAKIYERLLSQEPNNADFWVQLGRSYVQRGWQNRAIPAFEHAIQADETYMPAWTALCLQKDPRDPKTLEFLEKALAICNRTDQSSLLVLSLAIGIDSLRMTDQMANHIAQAVEQKSKPYTTSSMWEDFSEYVPDVLMCYFYNKVQMANSAQDMVCAATLEEAITVFPTEHTRDLYAPLEKVHSLYLLKLDEHVSEFMRDLLSTMVLDEPDEMDRLGWETDCLINLDTYRKEIQYLKQTYPLIYAWKKEFFDRALRTKQTRNLIEASISKLRRLARENGVELDFDEDDEDDEDETVGWKPDSMLDPGEKQTPYVRDTPKIGRNDPCPCGSGKKYKKCCGA